MATAFPLCGTRKMREHTKAEWLPLLDICSRALESVKFSGEQERLQGGEVRGQRPLKGYRGPWAVLKMAVSVLGEMNERCHVLERADTSDFLCDRPPWVLARAQTASSPGRRV